MPGGRTRSTSVSGSLTSIRPTHIKEGCDRRPSGQVRTGYTANAGIPELRGGDMREV